MTPAWQGPEAGEESFSETLPWYKQRGQRNRHNGERGSVHRGKYEQFSIVGQMVSSRVGDVTRQEAGCFHGFREERGSPTCH